MKSQTKLKQMRKKVRKGEKKINGKKICSDEIMCCGRIRLYHVDSKESWKSANLEAMWKSIWCGLTTRRERKESEKVN